MTLTTQSRTFADHIQSGAATRGVSDIVDKQPRTRSPAKVVNEAQLAEINRVTRAIKAPRTGYKRDFGKDTTDRIVDAIEYLTKNHPGLLVPITLLYWMCMPGQHTLAASNRDVLLFAGRVSRCKRKMLGQLGRTFMMRGGSRQRTGYIRGYTSREEHAIYEMPRAVRSAERAIEHVEAVKEAVGNPETLKVSATFTDEHKADAKAQIKRALTLITAYKALPAAPEKK